VLQRIGTELRDHAPFTAFGALTGMVLLLVLTRLETSHALAQRLFWAAHPLHVLLSASATTSMYRLAGTGGGWRAVVVGYVGSIGIASLSDCVIPYLGEWALALPERAIHLGFIEKWWLVNPLAFAGVALGYRWPRTRLPHAGHVLLSTCSSLFHMQIAMSGAVETGTLVAIAVFLFLAVWLPCCTSDIVFPLLVARADPGVRQIRPARSRPRW
jgi:hypothetical protein